MEKSQAFQSLHPVNVASAVALFLFVFVVPTGCSKPSDPPPPSIKADPADGKAASSDTPPSHTPPNDDTPPQPPAETIDPPVGERTADDALFIGWPKPRVALVITGLQQGYLEPCGCTGLENQKGGLMRRHTLLKQLSDDQGWNVVPVDLGGMVRRSGRQAEIKYAWTINMLKLMNYQAIGLGPKDLRLDTGALFAPISEFETSTTPFVSANVRFYDLEDDTMPAFRVIDTGGIKVGVTTVMGK